MQSSSFKDDVIVVVIDVINQIALYVCKNKTTTTTKKVFMRNKNKKTPMLEYKSRATVYTNKKMLCC